ncbi:MAG: hypothetical protein WD271_14425 [Acidimicrobiia bacterium]
MIDQFNEFADKQADLVRGKNRERVYTLKPEHQPSVDAALSAQLRDVLEDEIVPATELEDAKILPVELDHEVIKKALIGLKLETLKRVAERSALEGTGNAESLATRIAESYAWNREEIARLILASEDEPAVERAHVDRLYALYDSPPLDYVYERLRYVLGRYIRIGVARWFVFEELESVTGQLTLRGTLRAYNATVTEVEANPTVVGTPARDHRIELLVDNSPLLHVRHGSANESSAAVRALEIATRIQVLGKPTLGAGASAALATLAPASLFMLDLLTTRFGTAGLHNKNMTVARFQVDDDDRGEEPESRPRLRAVRFEGAHLLDSAAACKLLADEGRALVDMSITVRSALRADGETGRFPVRVAIERDHVLAMTGFGTLPGLSFGVHAAVVDAVTEELGDGLADVNALAELATKIEERARSTVPIEEADMLRDNEPST